MKKPLTIVASLFVSCTLYAKTNNVELNCTSNNDGRPISFYDIKGSLSVHDDGDVRGRITFVPKGASTSDNFSIKAMGLANIPSSHPIIDTSGWGGIQSLLNPLEIEIRYESSQRHFLISSLNEIRKMGFESIALSVSVANILGKNDPSEMGLSKLYLFTYEDMANEELDLNNVRTIPMHCTLNESFVISPSVRAPQN